MERAAQELRDAVVGAALARGVLETARGEELPAAAEMYLRAVAAEREALRSADLVRRIEARAPRV